MTAGRLSKTGVWPGIAPVHQKGRLQVDAGGTATNVTLKQGGALVTSTAATVTGINRQATVSFMAGKADNVVLENGGRLDVLTGHTATNTRVDDGGTLEIRDGITTTTLYHGKWRCTAGRFRCRCQWYPERRKGIQYPEAVRRMP